VSKLRFLTAHQHN